MPPAVLTSSIVHQPSRAISASIAPSKTLPPILFSKQSLEEKNNFNSAPDASKGNLIVHTDSSDAKIRYLSFAQKLQQSLKHRLFNNDIRLWGFSLEDMASRLQTFLGVYLLQGFSAIHDHKHPWETNGRNVVVWSLGLAVVYFFKHPRYGANALLDTFMRPKQELGPDANLFQRWINKSRLPIDYKIILRNANITDPKAHWSSLDRNHLDRLHAHYKVLKEREQKSLLTPEEKDVLKAMPGFFKRLSLFPMISTALITAATVWIIGDLAMKFVYRFIAPLDKDFDPSRLKPRDPHDTEDDTLFKGRFS